MKFSEFKYERPDIQQLTREMGALTEAIRTAHSGDAVIEAIEKVNDIRRHFDTMMTLVSIRYSLNTEDPFYTGEQELMDNMGPEFEALTNAYYKAIYASAHLDKAKAKYGDHFFKLIEVNLKAFDEKIIEDLKQENQLTSQYTKLRSSAKIPFEGEIRNLSQMGPFYEDPDPQIRKAAHLATSAFFNDHLEAFDALYDKLVKTRDAMARKMGFENYTPLGYLRLMRTDYGPAEVKGYREQILKELVPVTTMLRERQMKRLGLTRLTFADEGIAFLSGNAKPIGSTAEILENGRIMYHELSPETGAFIDLMYDQELMDVEARAGKSGGGYCTFLYDYNAPYIFSNFNGTSGDVDVLTHEAGHAFQTYQSRHYELPEYLWPTLDACEIHSMSMEFLTWPWMKRFFGDQADKYLFNHLTEAILFIPYGTMVDAFQHEVYAKPEMTPEARRLLWRDLEKAYLPHRDYDGDAFLESGGFWFRQGHIFNNPFYYIDYTLAQMCAFQFHIANQADHQAAWTRYLALCKRGGSASFLELVKEAGLKNPFEDDTVKKILPALTAWLEAQPDDQY
ncbi:M3 family oligoendopeptidase [Fusibacter paucivorans]|uniref:M3 family oligoendopeptidase n=1 Tax=Fusibacter paucivorans TaxID=76009 RepID=A0ABS5PRX3_9FIRM|nr:M3 family oligoendopeptidase [Fusibacter paucivorans]MBS7527910.1 M3 family oligoendopeptidase [Fusibacter paucivorans]